ncbi:MAG: hypothetical protein IPJ94_13850 [Chloroflexi bacterium]|nr:hypothetical protein [Chloroflexota bacterium]
MNLFDNIVGAGLPLTWFLRLVFAAIAKSVVQIAPKNWSGFGGMAKKTV